LAGCEYESLRLVLFLPPRSKFLLLIFVPSALYTILFVTCLYVLLHRRRGYEGYKWNLSTIIVLWSSITVAIAITVATQFLPAERKPEYLTTIYEVLLLFTQ
jgi:uncharacterized membrane-anchored protein